MLDIMQAGVVRSWRVLTMFVSFCSDSILCDLNLKILSKQNETNNFYQTGSSICMQ